MIGDRRMNGWWVAVGWEGEGEEGEGKDGWTECMHACMVNGACVFHSTCS